MALSLINVRDTPRIVAGTIADGSKWINPKNIEFIIIANNKLNLSFKTRKKYPLNIISSHIGATMQAIINITK